MTTINSTIKLNSKKKFKNVVNQGEYKYLIYSPLKIERLLLEPSWDN